jgi:hypothetical protein
LLIVYEAGVLYEVVNAIRQHNSQPDTKPEERIEIDLLTGASAGGMIATIAARKLMFEAGALRGRVYQFLRPIDVQLDGLTLDRMDRQPREQVRDRLCDRAHEIMAELNIGADPFAFDNSFPRFSLRG